MIGLEAEIADIAATLHPRDPLRQAQAHEARSRAAESAQAAASDQVAGEPPDFVPSDDIKTLYRQAAMRIHPDLASKPEERPRREQVMAAVNAAYESGDQEQLHRILREWEASPEAVTGEGAGADLIRLIRKIARVKDRLAALEIELTALRGSELLQLRAKVEKAATERRDLLKEMAAELDRQIRDARTRLLRSRKSEARKA